MRRVTRLEHSRWTQRATQNGKPFERVNSCSHGESIACSGHKEGTSTINTVTHLLHVFTTFNMVQR